MAPLNKSIVALNKINTAQAKAVAKACRAVAYQNDRFMRRLDGGSWDPSIRKYVNNVMDSAAGQQLWYLSCGKATSTAQLNALGDVPDPKPGAAQTLRVKLGIPGVKA